jgi:DNA-binding MarR family transcriptional regulator
VGGFPHSRFAHAGATLERPIVNDEESGKLASTADTIDYGPLEQWIGFNLRMAQTASFQAFARLSKDVGLTAGRFATLTLIASNPGISQTALSRANSRDKSTLTPLLNDLVRRGHVRRARDASDRRAYRLTLTPAGRKVLRQLTACARRHERKLDAIVGVRDRAAFLRTLRRIAAEIE